MVNFNNVFRDAEDIGNYQERDGVVHLLAEHLIHHNCYTDDGDHTEDIESRWFSPCGIVITDVNGVPAYVEAVLTCLICIGDDYA